MLNDIELLKLIMDRNLRQSPQYILEEFAQYKAGIAEINAKLAKGDVFVAASQEANESVELPVAAEPKKLTITRGYTKRSLKVKPEDAVTDTSIACCICGQTFKTLTTRHLATHNELTKEGYLKLCGYDETMPLMSRQHYDRMVQTINKAQSSRKAKLQAKR